MLATINTWSNTEIKDFKTKSHTRVQKKGQVTIPKSVREFLGIGEGDYVTFFKRGDEVVVRPVQVSEVEHALDQIEKYLSENDISTADLNAAAKEARALVAEKMFGNL
jgi:AbrB family looped-hinge helix DNA binding protein